MSSTTRRTLDLLALLQTPRAWSGAELCARLGVDPRTLRRDVERLRALGYGVAARRGVGGGYRLGAGEQVPPLALTEPEAMAVAIGLRAIGAAVADLTEASATALAKLERSLNAASRSRIGAVSGAVVPLIDTTDPVTADALALLVRAIREHRRVHADYTRHDGTQVRRQVEPHRIVLVGQRWYLVARDVDRDAWRTLRIDRLVPHEPLGARFVPAQVPEAELRRFTSRSISDAPYPFRGRIRVHADAEAVRSRLGPAVADVVARDDGTCEVVAGAQRWSELAGYVAMLDVELEILDPPELVDEVRRMAERLRRAAGTEVSGAVASPR